MKRSRRPSCPPCIHLDSSDIWKVSLWSFAWLRTYQPISPRDFKRLPPSPCKDGCVKRSRWTHYLERQSLVSKTGGNKAGKQKQKPSDPKLKGANILGFLKKTRWSIRTVEFNLLGATTPLNKSKWETIPPSSDLHPWPPPLPHLQWCSYRKGAKC